jgi:hypothetical protein
MIHDVVSDFNLAGGLPKGAAMRALDAEIAGEGAKVLGKGEEIELSNGDRVAWIPPPEKLVIPDISNVKSIRKYFGQRGHQVYPAWLYHPEKPALLVKDAKEAADVGIVFRKATADERNRYGLRECWDWEEGCLWRPHPYTEAKFDPKTAGAGKNVVYAAPDPSISQNSLLASLVPSVAAAVTQALMANGPAAPAHVDSAQWEQFLAFQAWQKTSEAVSSVAADLVQVPEGEGETAAEGEGDLLSNALTPEQDRALWEAEARRLGIEVDGRWSLKRLRTECEKVSGSSAA